MILLEGAVEYCTKKFLFGNGTIGRHPVRHAADEDEFLSAAWGPTFSTSKEPLNGSALGGPA